MPVICPKCSQIRPADATNPDWQCPACGICYAKFGNPSVEAVRPAHYVPEVKQGWELGTLIKIVLLVALGWGLNYAIKHRQRGPEADQVEVVQQQAPEAESRPESGSGGGVGIAVANTALRVSGADASMLHSLAGRLERVCARNKYGLSEQACLARLHAREDGCADSTAQRFPGPMADAARMQVVAKAYVACIFEDEG